MTLNKHILLGHGSGGKLMHDLIEQLFQPALLSSNGAVLNDAAVVQAARSASCHDDGFFRRRSDFFPGRRYRRDGGLRYRKRSRRERRAPAVSERRLHLRRGVTDGGSQPRRGFDASRV